MRIVTIALTLLALSLAVGAGAARADRYTRGETVYQRMCSSCHTVGWGTPVQVHGKGKATTVDLTGVVARHDPAALRRFVADPAKERPGTGCTHQSLTRDPVDDLINFLEAHAGPPPQPQVVPPASKLRKATDPPLAPSAAKKAR